LGGFAGGRVLALGCDLAPAVDRVCSLFHAIEDLTNKVSISSRHLLLIDRALGLF